MINNGSPVASAPAFVILIGLCVAISLRVFAVPSLASVALALLAASAWMCLGSRRVARGWLAEFALILLFILFASLWSFRGVAREGIFPFSSFETKAMVMMNRVWGKSRALLLETPYGRAVAYRFGRKAPPEGSTVLLRCAAFDLVRANEPHGFDEYLFWRAKGATKKLIVFESKILAPPVGLARWRGELEKRIVETLPERTAAYMLALTTGVRNERLTEIHRATGTQHLLAVSGFHVGIIAGIAMLFFFRGGLVGVAAVSLVVWFYILLAGAPAGGLRAAIMFQIYLLGFAVGKPSSSFNSVSMAGVLLLLCNPWSWFDLGWRLSMCAALFITAFFSFTKISKVSAVVSSVLVWLVTAPIVASAFESLPIAGLFMNILAVPLFAVLFPAIALCSLPALLKVDSIAFIAGGAEYFLEAWELLSVLVSDYMPWEVSYTTSLVLLGATIFIVATALASGCLDFSPHSEK